MFPMKIVSKLARIYWECEHLVQCVYQTLGCPLILHGYEVFSESAATQCRDKILRTANYLRHHVYVNCLVKVAGTLNLWVSFGSFYWQPFSCRMDLQKKQWLRKGQGNAFTWILYILFECSGTTFTFSVTGTTMLLCSVYLYWYPGGLAVWFEL